MEQNNCLVAQSGGPTVAINASLAGIIHACRKSGEVGTIYGAINGIQGVLSGNIVDMEKLVGTSEENLDTLKISPAMYLGSCRYKLAPMENAINPLFSERECVDDYTRIFNVLSERKIKYFFYIGGNDSMDTVKKLGAYGELISSPIRFIRDRPHAGIRFRRSVCGRFHA